MTQENYKCATCGRTGDNHKYCPECKDWHCVYHTGPSNHHCKPEYYRKEKEELNNPEEYVKMRKAEKLVQSRPASNISTELPIRTVRKPIVIEHLHLTYLGLLLIIISVAMIVFSYPIIGAIIMIIGILILANNSSSY